MDPHLKIYFLVQCSWLVGKNMVEGLAKLTSLIAERL